MYVCRGHPFSSGGRSCNLCLTEKLEILTADQNSMLNKRDKLLEACIHQRKHLLVSLFKLPSKMEPPDTTIKSSRGTYLFFKKTLQRNLPI
jgi:hypothetical protein